jgi:hypothetical protein
MTLAHLDKFIVHGRLELFECEVPPSPSQKGSAAFKLAHIALEELGVPTSSRKWKVLRSILGNEESEASRLEIERVRHIQLDVKDSIDAILDDHHRALPTHVLDTLNSILHSYPKALLIVRGDLDINGDSSTYELMCSDIATWRKAPSIKTRAPIIVFGDVKAHGHLEVTQHRDLIVFGHLSARSIRGHTSNLIVEGVVQASEMVLAEYNEEGGFFYASSFNAPLMLITGYGDGNDPVVEGIKVWARDDKEDFSALTRALEMVVSNVPETDYEEDYELWWFELKKCMDANMGEELVRQFLQERISSKSSTTM